MKYFFWIFIMVTTFSCSETKNVRSWNHRVEKKHLQNIQDSSTWDLAYLESDLNDSRQSSGEPMRYGVFPIPRYEIFGEESFTGVMNGANATGVDIDGKKVVYSYFGVGNNNLIKKYIGDKPSEVFFTIIVLTDFIDTANYSHIRMRVISRNHPDYIGQGFIKTQTNEIDYVAFLTAFRKEYAIVNMRLFNLKHGRIILIAPQKDGSLRSMQIKSPTLSNKEIDNYIKESLQKEEIKSFFRYSGNI